MTSYEIVVIGTGPAGHHAAIQAAKLGRSVAIIERLRCVGGVCINTGTIPSKTLREAVLYLSGFQQRGLYGHSYRVKQTITIQDLMFRCHHVIAKENDVYRSQFTRNGVDVLEGHASFVDPHTIKIEGDGPAALVRAERVVIATGTVPATSHDVPVDGSAIIDADGIFDLKSVPATMIVVGAGVIGMEYACMFATLGSLVTVVESRKRLLEFVDGEIIEALMYHMRENRVTFRSGESVERVAARPRGRRDRLSQEPQDPPGRRAPLRGGPSGQHGRAQAGGGGTGGGRPRSTPRGRLLPHSRPPHPCRG